MVVFLQFKPFGTVCEFNDSNIKNIKMKLFKSILYTVTILTFSFSVNGQKKWTLQDCINHAIENNIQLKQSKVNAEISENNYKQSKYNFLPSINGFANHNQNWGKTFSNDKLAYIDEAYFDGNFGVNAELDIFNGLNNFYTLKENKNSFLANKMNVEVEKNDIIIQITLAYLQVLYDNEMLKVTQDQVNTSKDQVLKTEKMVEIGNQAKGDLLEIKSQLSQEKVSLTNAKNQLEISTLNLVQILNLDTPKGFSISQPDNLDINDNSVFSLPEDIFETAYSIMPEIKSANYSLNSSSYALKKAKWSRLPSLSLSSLYYTRYSELANHPTLFDNDPSNDINNYVVNDQIKDFAYTQINLRLSIPLFNRMNTQRNINNAKLNLINNRYLVELQEQNLLKKIQQAHADATGALEKYYANIEAKNSTEESFKYSEQKYQVGMVDIIEYKIAKNNYTKAQVDLLHAKYEYIFKTKILEFYKGEQITL